MADISRLHYGVRYPNGYVADFGEDRDKAAKETRTLITKGADVELVTRRVGVWKRSAYRPPAVSNAPTTGGDTASDRGRPGHDTEGRNR